VSEQVIKSFQHIYKLLKIYLGIAALGGFIALAYGFLAIYPNVPYYVIIILILLFIFKKFVIDYKRTYIHAKLVAENRNIIWSPPASAEYLFFNLLPKDKSVQLVGDLNEEYQHVTKKNLDKRGGVYLANLWYWTRVLHSVPPLLTWRLKNGLLVGAAKKKNTSFNITIRHHQVSEFKNTFKLLKETLLEFKEMFVLIVLYTFLFEGVKIISRLLDLLIR